MVSLPLFMQGSAGVYCLGIVLRLVPAFLKTKVILDNFVSWSVFYVSVRGCIIQLWVLGSIDFLGFVTCKFIYYITLVKL